jgi:hypothetical protein
MIAALAGLWQVCVAKQGLSVTTIRDRIVAPIGHQKKHFNVCAYK